MGVVPGEQFRRKSEVTKVVRCRAKGISTLVALTPAPRLPEEVGSQYDAGGNSNFTVIRGPVGWAVSGAFDLVNLAGGQAALTSPVFSL